MRLILGGSFVKRTFARMAHFTPVTGFAGNVYGVGQAFLSLDAAGQGASSVVPGPGSMRDELPEEFDRDFKRPGRRLWWGSLLLGVVSILLYVLMRDRF